MESLKSLVSTKSTRLDRKMDTKTDTKPSLRIWPPNPSFGVHLGVHSSPENGSATLYHKARSNRRLEGDCRGPWRSALVLVPDVSRSGAPSVSWRDRMPGLFPTGCTAEWNFERKTWRSLPRYRRRRYPLSAKRVGRASRQNPARDPDDPASLRNAPRYVIEGNDWPRSRYPANLQIHAKVEQFRRAV